MVMALAMAASTAGDGLPSHRARLLAARIPAGGSGRQQDGVELARVT